MSDTETISIKSKRHVIPTVPFSEGDDVEGGEFCGGGTFGNGEQY